VLAVLLCAPLALVLWHIRGLLDLLGQQPAVAARSAAYIRAVVPGLPAFLLYATLRRTLQAMSLMRPAVVAMIIANVANVLGNYALIYGHWGAPALGVVGSGIATSISRWVMLLAIIVAARHILRPYTGQLVRLPFRLRSLLQPLRIGLPIGVQSSLEIWMFTAVALMMGHLGARELAAHQISLNLAAIAFMVPLGLSGAASTRVGNAIGRRDMPSARRAALVCLLLGGGVMTISALAFWLIPGILSRLYTPDTAVIALASMLLPIAALFQVFDGLQVVGSGVLRGAADTRAPAAMALVGFWLIGLPLAYLLAFRAGAGPRGLWLGLTLGLASVAILILVRVVRRFSADIAPVAGRDHGSS
jgi:MATE family multidrug resistance protein